MAMSKNILSTDMNWISELAKFELNPQAPNIYQALSQLDPKQIVEEATVEFMQELKDLFMAYARVFNGYSENNTKFSEVKIYGITNTAADFMLFRNNVKLVFANSSHGMINISFIQHRPQELAVDGQSQDTPQQQHNDILAQTGPFLEVSWTYRGEKVSPEKLVKYFFVDFVRASRGVTRESTNQLLLKQIKSLLQSQGINI
jgi:hypothetical protein